MADHLWLDIFIGQPVCFAYLQLEDQRVRERLKEGSGGRLPAQGEQNSRLLPALVLAIILSPLFPASVLGQTQAVSAADPFRPLVFPTPNEVRTGSGRPGAKYWQQQVNYKINAILDPAKNEVRGRETIRYVNRSPDALPYLWMFVEQNLCAPNSITNQLNQPPLVFLGASFDFSCQGFNGGLTLESIRVAGATPKHTTYGTTMRVDLATPLAPGATLDVDLAWRFNVPPQGGGRMGHDGPLYEIAQWYPRIAVYDDVHGWNHEPYIGAGEFYLEYGNFDVSVIVPASYIIAATGELVNPEHVLTPTQRERLVAARKSDTAIAIIRADEVGSMEKTRPRVYAQGELSALNPVPSLMWHYTATSGRKSIAWGAKRSSTSASSGIATRGRTRRPSKARSREWSTRC